MGRARHEYLARFESCYGFMIYEGIVGQDVQKCVIFVIHESQIMHQLQLLTDDRKTDPTTNCEIRY